MTTKFGLGVEIQSPTGLSTNFLASDLNEPVLGRYFTIAITCPEGTVITRVVVGWLVRYCRSDF